MCDSEGGNNPQELDPRFPSGPWKGYFLQASLPGRQWMRLTLDFRDGRARGAGRDGVGDFLIDGEYDLESGRCQLQKDYIGQHSVVYDGFNEGKGIWGTWEIPPIAKGGFHIWPEAIGEPDGDQLVRAEDIPIQLDEPVAVAID